MPFVSDTFTDTNTTLLSAHTGETGATWTLHTSYSGTEQIDTNRVRPTSSTASAYYASGAPATADYSVEAVLRQVGDAGTQGVCGRMDTSANTFYMARYVAGATNAWQLYKFVAGTATNLGSWAETLANGDERTVKLEMDGDQISLYVAGTLRVGPITDTAITAAGKAGIRGDTATGLPFDSFTATDAAAGGSFPLIRRQDRNSLLRR